MTPSRSSLHLWLKQVHQTDLNSHGQHLPFGGTQARLWYSNQMDDRPLCEDSIQAFKKLLAKHSGRDPTDAEALEAATRMVQFFRALACADREKKLTPSD